MSADGIPHKAAIIVIGRLNCPIASGVSDATDVPEKKNRLRGGTEIRVCEYLFADDLHGVTTVPRQSREPVKQRSQFGAQLILRVLEMGFHKIGRQNSRCCKYQRQLMKRFCRANID